MDYQDDCIGNDYYTYTDVPNTCQEDCTCTTNPCGEPTISYNDPVCTQCQDDNDCDSLDRDYCDGTEIKHDEGVCIDYSCEVSTSIIQDCDDGLYCNGQETCNAAQCVSGTPIDCSANNIGAIATCDNDPDNILSTWDFFTGFTSTCNEDTDTCETGTVNLTHTCDMQQCYAECQQDSDCITNPNGVCSSACVCEYGPYCGDGVKNGEEECDGDDPQVCTTTEGYSGFKNCVDCLWGQCISQESCGDGIQNGNEECDDGELNGQECPPPCEQTCTYCSSCCQLITLQGGSCGGGGGGGGTVITYYSPKLTIEKSVAETFANPGSTINYTIVFKNTGSAVAYNVILTDTLPDGLTYTDTGLSTREWDLGTLGAGSEKTITYQVLVDEDVVAGNYLNTVEVTANDLDPVSDEATIEIREGEVLGETITILPKTGVASSGISFILFVSLASLIFGTVELKKTLVFER